MGVPQKSVTITASDLAHLNQKLANTRHNINNHLALVVAAVELIRRKPELSPKFIESIGMQPEKVIHELKKFSEEFEKHLGPGKES